MCAPTRKLSQTSYNIRPPTVRYQDPVSAPLCVFRHFVSSSDHRRVVNLNSRHIKPNSSDCHRLNRPATLCILANPKLACCYYMNDFTKCKTTAEYLSTTSQSQQRVVNAVTMDILKDETCPFLRLPLEIRNEIYRYLLCTQYTRRRSKRSVSIQNPSVRKVNADICSSTQPICFGPATPIIHTQISFAPTARSRSRPYTSRVTRICLSTSVAGLQIG